VKNALRDTLIVYTNIINLSNYQMSRTISSLLYDNTRISPSILLADVDIHDQNFTIRFNKSVRCALILSTLDKLIMKNEINAIVQTINNVCDTQIINHSLKNDNIIRAYAVKNRVLNNGIVTATDKLNVAIINGMRIKRVDVKNVGINDGNIKLCTDINELNIYHNRHVTTCAPFRKSLRKL